MDFDTPPFSEYWGWSCSSSETRLCRLLGEVMLGEVMVDDVNYLLVALAGNIKALGFLEKFNRLAG